MQVNGQFGLLTNRVASHCGCTEQGYGNIPSLELHPIHLMSTLPLSTAGPSERVFLSLYVRAELSLYLYREVPLRSTRPIYGPYGLTLMTAFRHFIGEDLRYWDNIVGPLTWNVFELIAFRGTLRYLFEGKGNARCGQTK